MKHEGRCHCGVIRAEFETAESLSPRACQCGFCRLHGARTVSNPDGAAVLHVAGPVIRYRFGTKTTDYLICAGCGVYVAATAEIGGQLYVTLNLNTFADPRLDLAAEPAMMARAPRKGRNGGGRAGRRCVCSNQSVESPASVSLMREAGAPTILAKSSPAMARSRSSCRRFPVERALSNVALIPVPWITNRS